MKVIGPILWRVLLVAVAVLVMSLLVAALSGEANALSNRSHTFHKVTVRHPRAFPPSKAALLEQNAAIDFLDLHRFADDDDVREAVSRGELVAIDPAIVDRHLPENRRYLRCMANNFLQSLAMTFSLEFGHGFVVTSAVRTKRTQWSLRRWNHNAASVQGPYASSHLAGTTFDIGRKHFTREETRWMEMYLYKAGSVVIVEEERGQECFHIFVRG
jgi:hypothetical protein